MEFQVGNVRNITIHVLPTNRFKTYALTLFAGVPLAEDTVTSTALIPYVLRRGNAKYPETIKLRQQLDTMYGAGFGFNNTKRGHTQFTQFRMDIINDRFVQNDTSLLEDAIQYMGDMITDPLIEGDGFRSTYVESEKGTLKKQLESIINDKIQYASERCIQEMCANEPYRLNAAGRLEDLPAINSASLYQDYLQWLNTAKFDFYVVGDTTLEHVVKLVEQYFNMPLDSSPTPFQITDPVHPVESVKTIVDHLDVTQGKLNLGLRMNVGMADEQFPVALVYNGILGSFPHSKLFANVREKESLAYYCSSRYDAHKGILTINSGIEFENYEKALNIIKQQLDEMKAGNISELELNQTKAMLNNGLREILDNAADIANFDFSRKLVGNDSNIQQAIELVNAVTIEDVKQLAARVELDTIYFLRNRQEG